MWGLKEAVVARGPTKKISKRLENLKIFINSLTQIASEIAETERTHPGLNIGKWI